MQFASPWWLLLLLLVPAFLLLRWTREQIRRRAIRRLTSDRLLRSLLVGEHPIASWARFGLFLGGLVCLILALARPQVGYLETEARGRGRNIILAVDVSKSMLTPDVRPNRLAVAKAIAEDLILEFSGDRFGLIAFAGTAFMEVPLTTDLAVVAETLTQLDHDHIPYGGTNLAAALKETLKGLKDTESDRHALFLLSDGEILADTEDVDNLAREVRDTGVLVVAIGIGTAQGALIPDPEKAKQPLRDKNGAIVRSRLEPAMLQSLARTTNGMFTRATDISSVKRIARLAVQQIDRSALEQRSKRRPIDRYQWPLGLGILLILVGLCLRPMKVG